MGSRGGPALPLLLFALLLASLVGALAIAPSLNQLRARNLVPVIPDPGERIAGESSIALERASFMVGNSGRIALEIRNVGRVEIKLASLRTTGQKSNLRFQGNVGGRLTEAVWSVSSSDPGDTCWKIDGGTGPIGKGRATTITLTRSAGSCKGITTSISSGDVINIKVATDVGTFATAQFTVP